MANFYESFVAGAKAGGERQESIQRMNLLEEQNQRHRDVAQSKINETYRQQQLGQTLADIAEGRTQGAGPPGGGVGAAQDQLGAIMSRADQFDKSAIAATRKGFFDIANQFRDDARMERTAELDQRIKVSTATAAEADILGSEAKSIYDTPSLHASMKRLVANGYPQKAQELWDITKGQYTPELQPVLDQLAKMSMTAKEQTDTEHKVLTRAQTARDQRNMQQDRDKDNIRADQKVAWERQKFNTPKPGEHKAANGEMVKDTTLQAEYKIHAQRPSYQERTDLREAVSEFYDPAMGFKHKEDTDWRGNPVPLTPAQMDLLAKYKMATNPVMTLDQYKKWRLGSGKSPSVAKPGTPGASAPREWLQGTQGDANIRAVARAKGWSVAETRKRLGLK